MPTVQQPARPHSWDFTVDRFRERYPEVALTCEQVACCHYLERKGLRFAIDFGYESAPGIVWSEIDAEIEAQQAERWLD